MTDLVLVPAACYPVYPAIAARGPLARRRRDRRRRRRLRASATSPPATRRGCRCSTSARSSASASPRPSPTGATTWRDRALELLRGLGLDADFDVATDPFFGRSGRMLAASQREQALKFEIQVHDRRAGADRGRLLQLPPGPLRRGLRDRARRRRRRPHRLPRLRARADRAGAVPHPRPRPGRLAGRGPGGALARMSTATTGMVSLLGLDPATYVPHALHSRASAPTPRPTATRDILIELLHAARRRAAGRDGVHRCGWTSRATSGPSSSRAAEDLEALFGIDIHEMQPYRPLPQQIAEQIAAGRTMIVELDSWYLPDTASTSYRSEHVKTSVIAEAIDPEAERLRYFHNAGLHELDGEDYRGVFRLGPAVLRRRAAALHRARPLRRRRPAARARSCATRRRELLAGHLAARRPADEPVRALRRRSSPHDLPDLLAGDAAALPRLRLRHGADGRLGLRGRRLPRRLAAGRRRRRGLRGIARRSSTAARRSRFKLARRREFDPAAARRGAGRGLGRGVRPRSTRPSPERCRGASGRARVAGHAAARA